jgi:hypothetical protein
MKRRALVSGAFCALVLGAGCSSVSSNLVGRWRFVAVEGTTEAESPQQAEIEFREDGTFQGTAFVTAEGTVEKRQTRGRYLVSESRVLRVMVPGQRPRPPVRVRFEGDQLVLEEISSAVSTRFDRVQSP